MSKRVDPNSDRVRFFTAFLDYLVEMVLAILPHDPVSCAIKRSLLRVRGAKIGRALKLWRDVWIDHYRKLEIGDNVTLGKSTMLICGGTISIGDNCMIGHGTQIVSAGHRIPSLASSETMRFSGPEAAPIVIQDDVWIGAGAIILPGTKIHHGTLVAAGAVVTKDLPENVIAGGVPASTIKERS